jgi:hypothetical protein
MIGRLLNDYLAGFGDIGLQKKAPVILITGNLPFVNKVQGPLP